MFETAFLLAVDIGHHDLFMDLHYIAVKLGETEMAAAARAQASTLLSKCSSDGMLIIYRTEKVRTVWQEFVKLNGFI